MKEKTILFVSKGKSSASTHYRALAYFTALQSSGWHPLQLTVHGALSRLKLLGMVIQVDVVVILRKTFSLPFLCLLRLCSKNLIFDLDDAIFCRNDGNVSNSRQLRFERIACMCEQVWAGNLYLADMSGRYNESVKIMPTSLDYRKYLLKVEKNSDYFDLVWIGSRSTKKYLQGWLPVLESLSEIIPNLRLKIIADFDLSSERLKITAVPWSKKGEAEELSSAHIGIAPMSDDSWTKGKCGLKVLQYMAAGLPVVSSPVGVNKEIVEHEVTGYLAESPEEWWIAIEKLAHDSALRQAMGKAGQMRVKQYSIDVTYCKMAEALYALFR